MKSSLQNAASGVLPNSNLVILIVILVLAIFLRIFLIGTHGIWLDEYYSLYFAEYNLQKLIQKVAALDNHPPTYYILLHYWILLFGDSEVSLRMPSAILSVLSFFFTYKVGKLLFDARVAAIAGFLLALSGFSIYYAQEARMYSLLAFASVLSVFFLLKCLDNYVWSSTLLVYTHLYGLFIILAENLYVLSIIYIYSDKNIGIHLKKWVSAQIYILFLSLPWLAVLINRILIVDEEGFWAGIPTLTSIFKTFIEFSGTTIGLPVWILLLLLSMFSFLIIKTAPGRMILKDEPTPGNGKSIFLLSLLLLTPIILPYLVSQFVTPVYVIRCTIAGHFAFCLLVANGVIRIRWIYVRYAALAIVLMLSIRTIASEGYVHRKAAQIKQAVEHIEENIGKNDVVVICGDSHIKKPFRYYAGKQQNPINIIYLLKPDDEIVFPKHQEVSQLWFVRRTDRADLEWCKQAPQTVSHLYVQKNSTDTTFRMLEIITLEK